MDIVYANHLDQKISKIYLLFLATMGNFAQFVYLDYYANGNRELNRDYQQDCHLTYAMENETHTVITFSRKLHTCDSQDRNITEGTMRVIWAYHPEDGGSIDPKYHGSNRGSKSIRLLNPVKANDIPPQTPYFDLQNQNVSVPHYTDTTYWCQIFKMPVFHQKHHIIKIKPLIQRGHEYLVHHILLYQCTNHLNDSTLNDGHECYHPNMPDSFQLCETIIFAWAIGGQGFIYPPHVGLSIGTPNDPTYVMMEIHYDNPTHKQGLIDSSGLRLFYTSELKKYDAGVIETGVWVSLYHMIPPRMFEFMSVGHCTSECLEEALDYERPSGIHIFAVLLHAHLAGQALRTLHFRNGVLQKPLAGDETFDFNFQEFQYLKEERVLLPGDSLITQCLYNTNDRRNMTWGGLSTRNEMCLSYLMYYPRINLSRCESLPEIAGQLKFIGVKEIYKPVTTWPFIIKSPKKYRNLSFTEAMDTYRWSEQKGRDFNELVLELPINVRCTKYGQEEWSAQGMVTLPPKSSRHPWASALPCGSASSYLCFKALLSLLSVLCVANTQ
nr:PREDICTED: DBH-like monooxygenase protein 1 [Latimeria chalumnae]|eukprot:XP_014352982.1 PREDICTED: DBH-like monooxygenase protein 1 [Latimeria chalumnae]